MIRKALSDEMLQRLNTKRLLGILRSLHQSPEHGEPSLGVRVKTSPEWKEYHAKVKAILATREHVEKK